MTKTNPNNIFFAVLGMMLLSFASITPAFSQVASTDQIGYDPTAEASALAAQDAQVAKFKKLYSEDSEFKRNADLIKSIVTENGSISDKQWNSVKNAINVLLIKSGEKPLVQDQEQAMRTQVENDAVNMQIQRQLRASAPSGQISAAAISCTGSSSYVAAMYQPTSDINNGNGWYKTYAQMNDQSIYSFALPGYCVIEVTDFYNDEDHPTLDAAYDLTRQSIWGRIQDLETYFILVNKSTGSITRLSFQGLTLYSLGTPYSILPIYSGTSTWNNEAHNSAKVTSFSYYSTTTHPKVYVNTWNHALGEIDNNTSMSKTLKQTWTNTFIGNRMNAENSIPSFLRTYDNEDMAVAP